MVPLQCMGNRGAAASLLDQSESFFNGGSIAKANTCRCLVPGGKKQKQRIDSTHLESASASHHGAAASLLDQSESFFMAAPLQRAATAVSSAAASSSSAAAFSSSVSSFYVSTDSSADSGPSLVLISHLR